MAPHILPIYIIICNGHSSRPDNNTRIYIIMKPSSKRSNERGCCGVGFHGPAANWGAQSTSPSSSGRTIPATMNNTRFDSGGFLVCLVTSRIGRDTNDFSFFFSLNSGYMCLWHILYVCTSTMYIIYTSIYIYLFIFVHGRIFADWRRMRRCHCRR